MAKRTIFFNEAAHKYTDDLGNPYTSTTTVIGKYYESFNMKKMAEDCAKAGARGNAKYRTKDNKRGLTADEIMFQWDKLKTKGCDRGNERHNFLEDAIKKSNNYNRTAGTKFINDKIYTIPDIQENHNYGSIDLSFFITTGIRERYPVIYKVLEFYTVRGYKIYAEIGIYWQDFLISGLIDVLLVKDDQFILLDWKTNKDVIRYDAGYFDKDFEGNRTGKFIAQPGSFMLEPISHLPASTGNKYALQTSMYSYITELFGLQCKAIIICQVLHENYTAEDVATNKYVQKFFKDGTEKSLIGKEKVAFYGVHYMKDDIAKICQHHTEQINKTRSMQGTLFNQ